MDKDTAGNEVLEDGYRCGLCGTHVYNGCEHQCVSEEFEPDDGYNGYHHQCVPDNFKPELPGDFKAGNILPGMIINAPGIEITDLGLVKIAETLERIEELLEKIWKRM